MRHVTLLTDLYPEFGDKTGRLADTPPSPLLGLIESVFGRAEDSSRKAILFTAAESKAGVSWMASAVAAELAAAGRKVLLSDAEVVASLCEADAATSLCKRIGSGRIWVLGPEQAANTKSPLRVGRAQPAAILSALLEEFPHVVLDAPSLSDSDVALRLAPLVDGSVFVVREGKTESRRLLKACGLLTKLGGRNLGCVYNAH